MLTAKSNGWLNSRKNTPAYLFSTNCPQYASRGETKARRLAYYFARQVGTAFSKASGAKEARKDFSMVSFKVKGAAPLHELGWFYE
jgi:hypothetical protein